MNFLQVIQTILAILLLIAILAQNRGAGLGNTWGGSGEFYVTRRGMEKLLFRATVVIAALFIAVSFFGLLI